jgi:hypothetical protein
VSFGFSESTEAFNVGFGRVRFGFLSGFEAAFEAEGVVMTHEREASALRAEDSC